MIITIPKFNERQKATDNRHWVSIDCNIFHNKKMMPVIKADHAAFMVYVWLLSNADENGIVDLDDDSLRSNIMDALKVKSNNYNVQKRLDLLLKHRLIEFNLPSTSVQHDFNIASTCVQPSFNNGSTSVQHCSNLPSTSVQLESKHSFEPPETLTPLRARNKQTNSTDNTNNTYKEILEKEFETFWEVCPKKTDRKGAVRKFEIARRDTPFEKILDGMKRYKKYVTDCNTAFEFIKGPSAWLHNGKWDDELQAPRGQPEQKNNFRNVNQGHLPVGKIQL